MPRSLVLLVLLVGCGDDGGELAPDAPLGDAVESTYDFSCLTTAWPTTSPNPTAVNGIVRDYADTQGLAGITVEVNRASDDTTAATTVTAAGGAYQTSIASGGAALELYRRMSGSGFVTTRVYGSQTVTGSGMLQNQLLTTVERGALANTFGVTLDPQTGQVATVIRDCANAPVAGAQILVTPPGTNIGYFEDGVPAPSKTRTGSDGFAVSYGLPPGPVMVTIVHGTTTFRMRPVAVEAGGLALSFRQP